MSDFLRLREEKNCLNCGHYIADIYCSQCGQPNIKPDITLADLLRDFFHVITHFDGKFFQTLRVLFTRPGFLTRAYLDGKRRQYLPPVQMYVFTSALFFFIFYSFIVNIPSTVKEVANSSSVMKADNSSQEFYINVSDSSLQGTFKTSEEYIQYQNGLSKEKRDDYITRLIKISELKITNRISKNRNEAIQQLIQSYLNNFPKLLFLSLPLMAAILSMIFYRNKSFSYVSHLIFLLHLYNFTLIALLIGYLFAQLNTWTSWSIFNWLLLTTQLWIFYYGYKSMRNLYQTSKWKGRLQYLLFLFSGAIIMCLLLFGGIIFTVISA